MTVFELGGAICRVGFDAAFRRASWMLGDHDIAPRASSSVSMALVSNALRAMRPSKARFFDQWRAPMMSQRCG